MNTFEDHIDAVIAQLMKLASVERPTTDEDFTPDLAWALVVEFKEALQLTALVIAVLASKLQVAKEDLNALEDTVRSRDEVLDGLYR